jgi:hypothetical protein
VSITILLIFCTHQARTARREPLRAIVGAYEVADRL